MAAITDPKLVNWAAKTITAVQQAVKLNYAIEQLADEWNGGVSALFGAAAAGDTLGDSVLTKAEFTAAAGALLGISTGLNANSGAELAKLLTALVANVADPATAAPPA